MWYAAMTMKTIKNEILVGLARRVKKEIIV